MAKQRPSAQKRDREFKKKERERMKREKAALKRERRHAAQASTTSASSLDGIEDVAPTVPSGEDA